jgi:hypothetical protein
MLLLYEYDKNFYNNGETWCNQYALPYPSIYHNQSPYNVLLSMLLCTNILLLIATRGLAQTHSARHVMIARRNSIYCDSTHQQTLY